MDKRFLQWFKTNFYSTFLCKTLFKGLINILVQVQIYNHLISQSQALRFSQVSPLCTPPICTKLVEMGCLGTTMVGFLQQDDSTNDIFFMFKSRIFDFTIKPCALHFLLEMLSLVCLSSLVLRSYMKSSSSSAICRHNLEFFICRKTNSNDQFVSNG